MLVVYEWCSSNYVNDVLKSCQENCYTIACMCHIFLFDVFAKEIMPTAFQKF